MPRQQLLASFLKAAGTIGFFFYITAALFVIVIRPKWVDMINHSASQILGEVEEVGVLFSLTAESLTLASDSVRDTSGLLLETGEFIEETNILLRSVGEVVGERAPQTITATQDAVRAAQSGSKAVDSMLRGLSVLEPITGFSYDPEKTLSQSLNEISTGLEPLPETLREVQRQLNQVADELDEVHPSLDLVEQDLTRFSDNAAELSLQMKLIGENLASLPSELANFTQGVATFGWISTIILSVFLVLGAISNLSVFLVGNQITTRQSG